MSFSALRDLKKKEVIKQNRIFKDTIVVGDDIFSLALFYQLKNKFGADKVFLLSERDLDDSSLIFDGPSTLRGQANITLFKTYFPEMNKNIKSGAQFFKDLKFKKFDGRSKSEKLLWGEEFFTQDHLDLNEAEVFPYLRDPQFLEELSPCHLKKRITQIHSFSGDNAKWELYCSSGESFCVENLYWGSGPKEFLSLYSNKAQLSNQFIEFCDGEGTHLSLIIKFIFEKPITEKEETIFIPLSYTHEWGHFVGEFKNGSIQSAQFLTFIDKNHTSEEEVSKKIRILKKNLEKIFPEFKTASYKEYVCLTPKSPCQNIDDSRFPKQEFSEKGLFFFGVNAPLQEEKIKTDSFAYPTSDVSHFMRGFVTHQEILKSIFVK